MAGKIQKILLLCLIIAFAQSVRAAREEGHNKKITLVDDGLFFEHVESGAKTAGEFLSEQKITLDEKDEIFPSAESPIFSGSRIIIERAKSVTIAADGKKSESAVFANTVAGALWENGISLNEDDIVNPGENYPLRNKDKIEIIRVEIKEETIKKDIPFKTTENEDGKMSWRTRKVTQKGEKGIKEITYKVVSHNNKEISRKILNEATIKDPVAETVTQGTYVKVGKASTGMATWYAYTGTLAAASPWLPMGSYAKVTNKENGKSVIVKINDRGPFGEGRIIDLDKVAFAKIAYLGAGIVEVKVEPILN